MGHVGVGEDVGQYGRPISRVWVIGSVCVCVWGGGGYVLVCVDGMLCACMHACVSATIQPTNLRDNRPNEVDMCQLLT